MHCMCHPLKQKCLVNERLKLLMVNQMNVDDLKVNSGQLGCNAVFTCEVQSTSKLFQPSSMCV